MSAFAEGDRVRVAVDRMARSNPRVRPMTGHVGVVREVRAGAIFDRIRVALELDKRESWFGSDELALEES